MESQLPLPFIKDIFQHTRKQANKSLQPPKLKPRYHHDFNFTRCQPISSAHFITFRNEASILNESPSSSVYNTSVNESYFEQCFTKIAKIGEGSFGEVFKVRCKEDGLLYAVKMSKHLYRSETYRSERLEEVKRYEQFSDHENCVRFYKAWEQDDRLYMQMELCKENLEHYIERKKQVPEDKIWSILLDLLLALKSLHNRDLIHLDIKLDNVLIGEDESCKLADFGLVIDVSKGNSHPATEGDSRYIAPELMQGHFSKAADIFSLGIAILELSCCLELPSNGPLWHQLRSGILPENFIKQKSNDLQAVIKSMMDPLPYERPSVDQLLRHCQILSLLKRRKRWELLKKAKQGIRHSCRITWSKLCDLKTRFLRYFMPLFAIKLLQCAPDNIKSMEIPQVQTQIISSTPTSNNKIISYLSNDFILSESNTEVPRHYTPTSFATMKFVNSTPLNHSHNLRSRRDLTKTSFRSVTDGSDNLSLDKASSFLCLEEIEAQSFSFVRYPLDTSSLRGKKLFSDSD